MSQDDPFEASLKEMMNAPSKSQQAKSDPVKKVLKTANRQIGAGQLVGLLGHAIEAFMIALSCGSAHLKTTSRQIESSTTSSTDKNKAL
ncbi:CrfX protein [Pseudomonas sp. F1_0610]|uniref:CrfX protein n=1 Tax=Pseudomonas sp. F1_0610 TaxID=3114284 RepID=UPI0039C35C48